MDIRAQKPDSAGERDSARTAVILESLPLFRAGLASLLRLELRVDVTAALDDSADALQIIAATRPALAVLDADAVVRECPRFLRRVRRASAGTRVLLIGARLARPTIEAAGSLGVRACLHKSDAIDVFRDTITSLLDEDAATMHKSAARAVATVRAARAGAAVRALVESLTDREREVLRCLSMGLSVRLTAACLGVRPKTVETHKSHMMAKLDIHDRASLTHLAIQANLVPI